MCSRVAVASWSALGYRMLEAAEQQVAFNSLLAITNISAMDFVRTCRGSRGVPCGGGYPCGYGSRGVPYGGGYPCDCGLAEGRSGHLHWRPQARRSLAAFSEDQGGGVYSNII